VRIVSVNLNQRLASKSARARLEAFLAQKNPHLFLAQEPWRPSSKVFQGLSGYRFLSAGPRLMCCHSLENSELTVVQHNDRWQELCLEEVRVHNVYLSPNSSPARRQMFSELSRSVIESGRPALILGDFNMAPEPSDGRFGDRESSWTGPTERQAFRDLLSSAGLIDSTRAAKTGEQYFTFERRQQGKESRFRCDLALISSTLAAKLSVSYDHSVRAKLDGFTDHSALVVDLPLDPYSICAEESDAEAGSLVAQVVTRIPTVLAQTNTQSTAERQHPGAGTSPSVDRFVENSWRTARPGVTRIARVLVEDGVLAKLSVRTILDYGCGRGEDVEFYEEHGFATTGYDPAERFGYHDRPTGEYDLVTLVYVVNVLPAPEHRREIVTAAANHVRPGGYLLVAARSVSAIEKARNENWAQVSDGFVSHSRNHTFQKGIPRDEIAGYIEDAGLRLDERRLFKLGSAVSWRLGSRPE
jgi:exonuclease III/SAM-dependent methyltransferase